MRAVRALMNGTTVAFRQLRSFYGYRDEGRRGLSGLEPDSRQACGS
jgi:hypothetical protein